MNPFIVADSLKCIGCRTCEVACVVAHQDEQACASVSREAFLPRIRVVKGGTFSTAVACHQCEDAPCALPALSIVKTAWWRSSRRDASAVRAVCWRALLGR